MIKILEFKVRNSGVDKWDKSIELHVKYVK